MRHIIIFILILGTACAAEPHQPVLNESSQSEIVISAKDRRQRNKEEREKALQGLSGHALQMAVLNEYKKVEEDVCERFFDHPIDKERLRIHINPHQITSGQNPDFNQVNFIINYNIEPTSYMIVQEDVYYLLHFAIMSLEEFGYEPDKDNTPIRVVCQKVESRSGNVFAKTFAEIVYVSGRVTPDIFTSGGRLPPYRGNMSQKNLIVREMEMAERSVINQKPKLSIPRSERMKKAIISSYEIVNALKRDPNGVKLEDEANSTIWIDIISWQLLPTDVKNTLILAVGYYFMDMHELNTPLGVIRSSPNGEVLAETIKGKPTIKY